MIVNCSDYDMVLLDSHKWLHLHSHVALPLDYQWCQSEPSHKGTSSLLDLATHNAYLQGNYMCIKSRCITCQKYQW